MPGTGSGPTITAKLKGGPLSGRAIQVAVLEGRPPMTLDTAAADGSTCRYCLDGLIQSGRWAVYSFLYLV